MRKNPDKKSRHKLETESFNSGYQIGFNKRSNMPVPIAFNTLNPKDLEII